MFFSTYSFWFGQVGEVARIMNQNYALAIHTASPDLGLAIGSEVGNPRIQVWENLGRDLSTQFHQHLAEFIFPQTWADLAFIAVAKGPGGFTGTRLGVVAARTLAQQLKIPLLAISTLAAAAWKFQQSYSQNSPQNYFYPVDIAVQMPAQRGELHTAIYSVQPDGTTGKPNLTVKHPDAVLTQEEWLNLLQGWDAPYQVVPVEGGLGNTIASLLELAYLEWQNGHQPHWSEALPFYGQSPV